MAGTLGEESNKIHQDSDVDNSTVALHHTLGKGANQSAAGNHNHDEAYSERTHTHSDLSGGDHAHTLGTLSDVTLNAPSTSHFLGYGPDGKWTNEALPNEAHSQLGTTPPVPRGIGDLWVDTSADLLTWDDAWQVPTLINGWVALSADWPVKCRRFPGGLVVLTGLIINPSARANYDMLTTLPSGCRPSIGLMFASVRQEIPDISISIDVFGQMAIQRPYGTPFQWVSLHCTFAGI